MINVKIENGRTTTTIHCKGIKEVVADTAVILKTIHNAVEEINEDAAKEFERYLDELMKDGIMFHEDRMAEEVARIKEEREEEGDSMSKMAGELARILKKALDLKEEGDE